MEHGWRVLGCLLLVAGPVSLITLRLENRKIKWPVWERGAQAGAFISVIGFFAGIFLAVLGCGGSQPEAIGIGEHNSADVEKIGSFLAVAGVGAYVVFAILWARKRMECRWCELLAKWGLLALLAGLATLLVSFNVGCGTSLPQPTDPVTVEVTVCEPTLGGTAGQYLRLSAWRRAEGICDEMLESSEARQQEIREATERDINDLNRELDPYLASGRTDCYNGPVFNELQNLVEEKRRNGTLCREP